MASLHCLTPWSVTALAVAWAVVGLAGCAQAPSGDQAQTFGPQPTPPWAIPPTAMGPPAPAPAPAADRPASKVLFGLDADSLPAQQAAGLAPHYATVWVGVWNLDKGWRDTDVQLRQVRALGVTPAIQFYYWDDDLSQHCFERGCNGKTTANWDRLADQLAEHLQSDLEGAPALVVLETEFNKGSVATYEPFDALLAAKATGLKAAYPAAEVVLGLGNWNHAAWPTWDRAAAASDAVGLQALAGSARGLDGKDPGLFNETLSGVRELTRLFGKPVVLQDVAAPSGPTPASPLTQAEALAPFVDRLDELEAAGVQAILYRSFLDSPAMSLANFFGEAERHFGLAEAGTGDLKPAGETWTAALRAAHRSS